MFTAVSNLGAGGTQDVVLYDISQGVLYGTFALGGVSFRIYQQSYVHITRFQFQSILRPCIVLGPRLSLFIGTLGYVLYVGSLWW